MSGGCSETDFMLLESRHFRDSQRQENLTLLRQRTGDKVVMTILWKQPKQINVLNQSFLGSNRSPRRQNVCPSVHVSVCLIMQCKPASQILEGIRAMPCAGKDGD